MLERNRGRLQAARERRGMSGKQEGRWEERTTHGTKSGQRSRGALREGRQEEGGKTPLARREREKPGERGGARGISKDRDPQRQTKIMECVRQPAARKRKSGGASEKRKRKRKRGRVRKRETRTETLQFAELLAE